MEVNLDATWEKLLKMPAVLVGSLQYKRSVGLISDYCNAFEALLSMYSLANEADDSTYNKGTFLTHALATETYHSYLERRLEAFNDRVEQDHDALVERLENWEIQHFVRQGCSTEIRTVPYEEFMGALYHPRARAWNRMVRDLRNQFTDFAKSGLSYDDMDHRGVFVRLKEMYNLHSDKHKLQDINEAMISAGFVV